MRLTSNEAGWACDRTVLRGRAGPGTVTVTNTAAAWRPAAARAGRRDKSKAGRCLSTHRIIGLRRSESLVACNCVTVAESD
eukprot:755020-Hanusia_phi.AAC.3